MNLLALLLLPLLAAADTERVRAYSEEMQNACTHSMQFRHGLIQRCPLYYQKLVSALSQITDSERKLAEVIIAKNSSNISSSTNIDQGAQCAQLRILRLGEATATKESDVVANIMWDLNNSFESLKEIAAYLKRFPQHLPKVASFTQCLNSYKGRPMRAIIAVCGNKTQVHPPREMIPEWSMAGGSLEKVAMGTDTTEKQFHAMYPEMVRLFERWKSATQKVGQKLADTRGEAERFKASREAIEQKYDCGPLRVLPSGVVDKSHRSPTDEERQLRDSTTKLGGGTGFKVKATNEKGDPVYRDATALHVAAQNWDTPEAKAMNLEEVPAGQPDSPGKPSRFELTPNDYSQQWDQVFRDGQEGPALKPVDATAIPTEGQEFTMAGHPGALYDREYVNMTCTFAGYDSETSKYAMRCPTNNSSVGGMSGGPVIDSKTGAVWGITNSQPIDTVNGRYVPTNIVYVSPLSITEDGALVSGQQHYVQSKNCYAYSYVSSTWYTRPCLVTPMGTQ